MVTKVIQSGDLLEFYTYEYEPRKKIRRYEKRTYKRVIKPSSRRADNLYRQRKSFIRLVRTNLSRVDSPAFFTFTMYEVLSIKRSYRAYTEFIVRLRKVFGKDFSYIGVPEFQKRGAVHFHVLIWGLPVNIIKNERRNRDIQKLWCRGFVDCLQTDGHVKLAGYLGKYMFKAMQDNRLLSQKSYFSSRNALRSVSFKTHQTVDKLQEMICPELSTLRVYNYVGQWTGKVEYRSYLFPNIKKYDSS